MSEPAIPRDPDPEFSRMVDTRRLPDAPLELVATADERAALARRFALVAIDALEASVSLEKDGSVVQVSGEVRASIVQPCAISGDDLPATIAEPFALRLVPEGAPARPDEEIELDEAELDEIPFDGTSFDIGEAVAQSLALAIDPYAVGPDAERVRDEHGLAGSSPNGPLQAALGAALKGK